MAFPPTVTFYTRPGCHLCEDAYPAVASLAREFGCEVETVDITRDAEAHRKWWADIPVVVIGSKVFTAPIHRQNLRRAFASFRGNER